MFGTHFYHKRVRSAVSVFGSLFNNLYVLRQNSAGETISQVKVPLSYAPKRNFLARIEAMTNGEQNERVVAIKLPRMSFEINGIAYDETRQLNKMNNLNKVLAGSTVSRQKLFTATPYNINFDLNVPIIVNGGINSFEEIKTILENNKIDAIGIGAKFIYYGPHRAVLISYINEKDRKLIK